ncbi:hypothetical protein V6N13_029869 [Hibiscus sabdariffa]
MYAFSLPLSERNISSFLKCGGEVKFTSPNFGNRKVEYKAQLYYPRLGGITSLSIKFQWDLLDEFKYVGFSESKTLLGLHYVHG